MKYEFRGKTVKEAILKGLKKLGLKNAQDKVSITIVDEGARGLFESSEPQRPAVVMMELKTQDIDFSSSQVEEKTTLPTTDQQIIKAQKEAKKFLKILLGEKLKIDFEQINTTVITGRIYINVILKDKNSTPFDEDTIFSIETILNELINKKNKYTSPTLKLHLDFNFLIRHTEEKLRQEAIEIARKVASSGVKHQWHKPLCHHYRKVIHDAVRQVKGVSSVSKPLHLKSENTATDFESGWGEKKIVEIYPQNK